MDNIENSSDNKQYFNNEKLGYDLEVFLIRTESKLIIVIHFITVNWSITNKYFPIYFSLKTTDLFDIFEK